MCQRKVLGGSPELRIGPEPRKADRTGFLQEG